MWVFIFFFFSLFSYTNITGITQATKVKQYTDTKAVNELDLQEAMSKLRAGDTTLEELNLNNHPDMTEDILVEIVDLLKNNTSVKKLLLANTQLKDHLALVCFVFFLFLAFV